MHLLSGQILLMLMHRSLYANHQLAKLLSEQSASLCLYPCILTPSPSCYTDATILAPRFVNEC
jgi:hypothetical protein